MKVLVVGNGAREHAITWKLAQSPKIKELFTAPGNAGTTRIAQNLDIAANDIKSLGKAAQQKNIDLVVVGPEVPLAEGIVDYFRKEGLAIVGPTKSAARLEATEGELRVTIAAQSSPHRTAALAALCAQLDAIPTTFPGTVLKSCAGAMKHSRHPKLDVTTSPGLNNPII